MKNIFRFLYDKYCLWRYGKTHTQVVQEYMKALERRRFVIRMILELESDGNDIDHNLYFGDRD